MSWRERAHRLRAVPSASVLKLCGAQPDPYDPGKWHTRQGVLTITGAKFMNWNCGRGGGGAIDLVMHLQELGFGQALEWLESHFGGAAIVPVLPPPRPPLSLPPSVPDQLQRVRRYLIQDRHLPPALLEPLIRSGDLYADPRANAVFLLRGKLDQPVGAELRGTTDRRWRGMAPGSQKDLGYFSIARAGAQPSQPIILCESAIDAISCAALYPGHHCLSTAGARAHPQWLAALVGQGLPIYCGFDSDPTGDSAANAMISLYPVIRRLRPPRHDWNDVLTAHS